MRGFGFLSLCYLLTGCLDNFRENPDFCASASGRCDPASAAPVCDRDTGRCRACRCHSECPSQACDVDQGRCYPEEQVRLLDPDKDCTSGLGDKDPCLKQALTSGRPIIRILKPSPSPSGFYQDPDGAGGRIAISSGDITVIGSNCGEAAVTTNSFRADGTSTVTLVDLTVQDNGCVAAAVECRDANASLFVRRSVLQKSKHGAYVESTGCKLMELDGARVIDNDGFGVSYYSGAGKTEIRVLNSEISRNQYGVKQLVPDGKITIANTLIYGNRDAGIFVTAGTVLVTFTTLQRNKRDVDCSSPVTLYNSVLQTGMTHGACLKRDDSDVEGDLTFEVDTRLKVTDPGGQSNRAVVLDKVSAAQMSAQPDAAHSARDRFGNQRPQGCGYDPGSEELAAGPCR